MKVVIVGCGRVGALAAEHYDRAGHRVVVVDISTRSFDRLPDGFRGTAVRGNGTDEDVLRRAGVVNADVFLALTEGDNRNVMAAQIALEHLGAARVVAKVNDPVRAEAYAALGLPVLCRTSILVDSLLGFLGERVEPRPGVIAPTGGHPDPDGQHAATAGPGSGTASGDGAAPATGREG